MAEKEKWTRMGTGKCPRCMWSYSTFKKPEHCPKCHFFLVGGKYKHVNPSQKGKKLDNPDAVAVCKFSNNSLFSVKSPQEMTACFFWCQTRLYALESYQDYCTWYILCKFSKGKKSMACNTWTYKYNSMICYRDIRCP